VKGFAAALTAAAVLWHWLTTATITAHVGGTPVTVSALLAVLCTAGVLAVAAVLVAFFWWRAQQAVSSRVAAARPG